MPAAPRDRRDHRAYRRKAAQLKRQEHVCWRCGNPIDPELKSPHPWSFTADHVVPIARGGHLMGEIRACHRKCNERRGAGRALAPQTHSRQW